MDVSFAVEITDLKKSFAGRVVLDRIQLNVAGGQVFGLLGPNGAGKTTLLRLVCALLRPDSGSVRVAGHAVVENNVQALAQLGVVNNAMGLYERFTGRENITLFGRLAGMDKAQIASRIEQLCQTLDIGAWVDQPARAYSTGMRQKILIARAVVHDPKVLILDEASNGLDIYARRGLLDFSRQFADAGGLVIYSTHVLSEAESLCDSAAIMDHGKILFHGTTAALREHAVDGSLESAFFALANANRVAGKAEARS